MLLHRHPLSTPRNNPLPEPRSIVATADRKGKGKVSKGTVVTPSIPEAAVPIINLLAGVPGLEEDYVIDWAAAEKKAFADRKAYDPVAQLNVSEVAVS
jgi:E3 ubiquitin-protein ligase SHPRH